MLNDIELRNTPKPLTIHIDYASCIIHATYNVYNYYEMLVPINIEYETEFFVLISQTRITRS